MVNIKIDDFKNNSLFKKERLSKVIGKIANDIRMKSFFKNEDGKKHKYGDMSNYIFEN